MKKRFWTVPLMMLAVVCSLVLAGCGGPSAESLIRKDIDSQLSELSVDNEAFMTAVEQSGGASLEQLGIEPKEFAKTYLEGWGYKIGEISVDEQAGTATADVTLKLRTFTDIATAMQDGYEDFLGSVDLATLTDQDALAKEMGKFMMDVVAEVEPQDVEMTFDYEKNEDGTWEVTEESAAGIMEAMQ